MGSGREGAGPGKWSASVIMQAPPSDNLYVTDLPAGLDEESLREIFSAYGQITQCRVLTSATPGQGKCAALVRFTSEDEATWVVENLDGNIPQGLTEPIGCRYADTPEMKAQRQRGYGKYAGAGRDEGRITPYGGGKGALAGGYGKGGKDKGSDKGGGRGGGKGVGKTGVCNIRVLHDGLLQAKALPGGPGWVNDENALYIANLPVDTQDVDLYRIFAPFGAIAPKGARAMLNPDGSCKGFGFVNFLEAMAAQSAVMTLNGTWMPDGTTLIVRTKAPSKTGRDSWAIHED